MPDFGFHPTVMVPQEHINWLTELPKDVLSARKAQVFSFQGLIFLLF